MKIAVDTNVILRVITGDTPQECALAVKTLADADEIAISLLVFAEALWVLKRLYKNNRADLIRVVELLMVMDKAVFDRPSVEAGLAALKAGGDFADGVIAFEGRKLGGRRFVTFDKKAAKVLSEQGVDTDVLSAQI